MNDLPQCAHRSVCGKSICYCRHPKNCGPERSVAVRKSDCQACPLLGLSAPPATFQPPRPPAPLKTWKLGDQVSAALATVGVTEERVSAWLGQPCGCAERREKLNRLSEWAQQASKATLEAMLGD